MQSNRLAQQVQTGPPAAQMRSGVVSKVSAPFTVTVDGTAIPMAKLAWYSSPALNDVVTVVYQGGTWLCLGKQG